ncbi:PREDICTED: uncharacterized protein LOC106888136 [Calidris pugnax]|uniref:uncharacterized protein LOC106888136 n=1 Tax=Calidris pugnax TaxID=198806 RepID=UPI00071DB9D8|nr:PREDICTED: uncharacterized protein LOC106888136 [Calidris pugnax]
MLSILSELLLSQISAQVLTHREGRKVPFTRSFCEPILQKRDFFSLPLFCFTCERELRVQILIGVTALTKIDGMSLGCFLFSEAFDLGIPVSQLSSASHCLTSFQLLKAEHCKSSLTGKPYAILFGFLGGREHPISALIPPTSCCLPWVSALIPYRRGPPGGRGEGPAVGRGKTGGKRRRPGGRRGKALSDRRGAVRAFSPQPGGVTSRPAPQAPARSSAAGSAAEGRFPSPPPPRPLRERAPAAVHAGRGKRMAPARGVCPLSNERWRREAGGGARGRGVGM